MADKEEKLALQRIQPNQCSRCKRIVEPAFSSMIYDLLPWRVYNDSNRLQYCHFCMDTQTCSNCMKKEKVYIPRDLQIIEQQKPKRVCKDAFKFIQRFKCVKIDKRNPIVTMKPELRQAMVLRRKVHKLFDSLKCPQRVTILAGTEFRQD